MTLELREGWRKTTIGDEAFLQRGFDTTRKTQRQGMYPVISSGGVSSFHDEYMARGPGVIIGRKGTLGTVFFIREDYWPHDTTLWVKEFNGNDPQFVYYFFKNLDVMHLDVGSANPTLNRNHVHPIQVVWPIFETQRAIASVLGALDDKIELNRRMNRTLEATARALFKSWFVDFDPVHANAEGRVLEGLSADVQALFPSSFEGGVPSGWEVQALSSICQTQYGYTASSSEEKIGPHFLRITDMNKQPWIDWSEVPYCEIESNQLPKYQLRVGDVLVSRMADPGKAAIVEHDISSVFASYLIRLATDSLKTSYFLFYILTSDAYLAYAQGASSGSVQRNMNARVITAMKTPIPNAEIIDHFAESILPLRSKIAHNVAESKALATARDSLLPKLLSGELEVRDVQDSLEVVLGATSERGGLRRFGLG